MKKAAVILIWLAFYLALDLGAAQYCRANCEFWISAYPDHAHRIRHPVYHHDLAADKDVDEAWGLLRYSYATNSLGFKDASRRTVPLRTRKKRLVFIGDSFTEGKGFPFPETFVGHLAKGLAPGGVEVLNAAVDSYAPALYLRKARHLLDTVGLQFDTLVVFLDVSDVYDQARRYDYGADGRLLVPEDEPEPLTTRTAETLRDRSATFRLLALIYDHLEFMARIAIRRLEISFVQEKPFWQVSPLDLWVYSVTGLEFSAWTYDDDRWQDYGARGRQRAAAEMAALADLLKARGVNLVLAVYPWPDQMFHDPESPRHRGFWKDWAKDRNVPFVDLFPVFTKGNPREKLEKLFIANDFHWNANGHQLVAGEVQNALRKMQPAEE